MLQKIFIFILLLIVNFILVSTTMLAIGLVLPLMSSLFNQNSFLDTIGKFSLSVYPYTVGIAILVSWFYFLSGKNNSTFSPLLWPIINILFIALIIGIGIILWR